jgi:hypothetical protein
MELGLFLKDRERVGLEPSQSKYKKSRLARAGDRTDKVFANILRLNTFGKGS